MTTKKTRIKHSPEFKAEALRLAEKVGVAATARQQDSFLYMNLKSTGGGRTRRKTPILVSESKS